MGRQLGRVKGPRRPSSRWPGTLPGVALSIAGAGLAIGLGLVVPVAPLMLSMVLGLVIANVPGALPASAVPGLQFSGQVLLRVGIVLLGFRLVIWDLGDLGGARIGLVLAVVASTLLGTLLLGAALKVSREVSLLTAIGFSICGASAIVAAGGVTRASKEGTAASISLVMLYGSVAVVALPVLGHHLGLGPEALGAWVGASVHDVGQVVAASSAAGGEAMHVAVMVKLGRVVLLVPVLIGLTLVQRRRDRARRAGGAPAVRSTGMPVFVVGFLAAAGVRSADVLGEGIIDVIGVAETWALCAALVGLGSGISVAALRRLSAWPLALGLLSWLLIATISLVGGYAIG